MKRPSILIVKPNAFYLGLMGGNRRLFHLAHAFDALGFDTVLLAGKAVKPQLQQRIDAEFPGAVLRTGHTGDYPRLIDWHPLVRRIARAGWKLRGDSCYWHKLSCGWADRLDVARVKDEFLRRGIQPTLVWGICGGYLDGAVAADRMAGGLGVPWVFELWDPPWRAGLGSPQEGLVRRFQSLLQRATSIVVVTDNYRKWLVDRFELSPSKVHTVHWCYEGEMETDRSDTNDRFTLLYAGTLEGGRSIEPLVQALVQVIRKEPEAAASVCVQLVGTGPGFRRAVDLARRQGIDHLFTHLGYRPYSEVQLLQSRASALVNVQTPETSRWQIPGKTFEYLRTLRPIIGIMPKESEIAHILQRSGLGIVHDREDIHGLAETIIRLWRAWRYNQAAATPFLAYISGFSLEYLPDKLRRVLTGAVELPQPTSQ